MKIRSDIERTGHLYGRAAFGFSPTKMQGASIVSVEKAVSSIFLEAESYKAIEVVRGVEEVREGMDKQDLMKQSRAHIKALNNKWLVNMVTGEGALREKMALFWHGHFACRSNQAFFVQSYLNTLRQHALGHFGDLLMAIAKDSAMLQFLNNQQNRKDAPNENFAREVMELFTLGRGLYTESDIKNAARAFTGWGFTPEGEFVFRKNQHDTGSKTFMGKTGNFTGEDILQLLLENRQTAHFITTKLYTYFVNEQPNEAIIKPLANQFYESGYDIKALMKHVFLANWFYEPQNRGVRIKSPIELLVGLQRTFGIQFEEAQSSLFIQKVLGQVLFYPPNVAGWAEGKNWIDSSSLLFRLNLLEYIFKGSQVALAAKRDGDVNTEYLAKKKTQVLAATFNWKPFLAVFNLTDESQLLDQLAVYLLPVKLSDKQKALVRSKADPSTKENLIKSLAIAITMLPEYQLC